MESTTSLVLLTRLVDRVPALCFLRLSFGPAPVSLVSISPGLKWKSLWGAWQSSRIHSNFEEPSANSVEACRGLQGLSLYWNRRWNYSLPNHPNSSVPVTLGTHPHESLPILIDAYKVPIKSRKPVPYTNRKSPRNLSSKDCRAGENKNSVRDLVKSRWYQDKVSIQARGEIISKSSSQERDRVRRLGQGSGQRAWSTNYILLTV